MDVLPSRSFFQEQLPGVVEDEDLHGTMQRFRGVDMVARCRSGHAVVVIHGVEKFLHARPRMAGRRRKREIREIDPLPKPQFFGPDCFRDAELFGDRSPVESVSGEHLAELFAALRKTLFDELVEPVSVAIRELVGVARGERDQRGIYIGNGDENIAPGRVRRYFTRHRRPSTSVSAP